MRLCHINLSKELRGGEIQMMALIECLVGRYEQSLVLRRDGLLHRRLEQNVDPRLALIPVPSSIIAAVRAARDMDLLHVHEGRSVPVGALRSLLGTPFVLTRRVPKRPGNNAATRWAYRRARAIVGVSDAVSSVMRNYVGATSVETILDFTPRLAVDAERVAQLQQRFAGRFVVGHVGELDDSHKGQLVILEAARLAQASHPELHFVLVGSGRDEPMLREQAKDLKNVEFIGRVENVGDYYTAMDVFVFPSRREALGSAMLEAMSCGLPVVAADVGGIPEVVKPGENGALFVPGDAAAMLAWVVKLAEDPGLREQLAAGARAAALARRAELGATSYISVYERALEL